MNPTLVITIPKEMVSLMKLGIGTEVMWRLTDKGTWELIRIEKKSKM